MRVQRLPETESLVATEFPLVHSPLAETPPDLPATIQFGTGSVTNVALGPPDAAVETGSSAVDGNTSHPLNSPDGIDESPPAGSSSLCFPEPIDEVMEKRRRCKLSFHPMM